MYIYFLSFEPLEWSPFAYYIDRDTLTSSLSVGGERDLLERFEVCIVLSVDSQTAGIFAKSLNIQDHLGSNALLILAVIIYTTRASKKRECGFLGFSQALEAFLVLLHCSQVIDV